MNFIQRHDNLLTRKECTDVIEWIPKNLGMNPDVNKKWSGYDYCDIMDVGENPHKCFSPPSLRPLLRAITILKDSYIKNFPEVDRINPWGLQYVRFKHWQPGYSYSKWHSEHEAERISAVRMMSFLIYLSDNDSYTEFRRYRNVRIKAGRGILFPAYFTHEHRGSICKKGLDRYILSGYFAFL